MENIDLKRLSVSRGVCMYEFNLSLDDSCFDIMLGVFKVESKHFPFPLGDHIGPLKCVKLLGQERYACFEHIVHSHCNTCFFSCAFLSKSLAIFHSNVGV